MRDCANDVSSRNSATREGTVHLQGRHSDSSWSQRWDVTQSRTQNVRSVRLPGRVRWLPLQQSEGTRVTEPQDARVHRCELPGLWAWQTRMVSKEHLTETRRLCKNSLTFIRWRVQPGAFLCRSGDETDVRHSTAKIRHNARQ